MSSALIMRGRYYILLFIEKEGTLMRRSDPAMSQGLSMMEVGPDPWCFLDIFLYFSTLKTCKRKVQKEINGFRFHRKMISSSGTNKSGSFEIQGNYKTKKRFFSPSITKERLINS
jgi:hypothetical protein